MAFIDPKTDGQPARFMADSTQQLLTAREKKLLNTMTGRPDHYRESNGNSNGNTWSKEDDEASEWKAVPTEVLKTHNMNSDCSSSSPITFLEAWSFFQSCDMSEFSNRNDLSHPPNSFRQKLQGFMGHPALNSALLTEKDLVFAVAACPMNNDSSVHRRILQSIYTSFTKKDSCPRYGHHWEDVGFQGQDPASDLRGAGMFGALQMLHLSSNEETKNGLAVQIYELSRHPVHQFPLAVLSLNVTRMTLDALRDGILNRICNKNMDCIGTCQNFYLAIMYRICKKWKEKKMTIHDSCYLLKSVEKWCRNNPQKAFSRLKKYLLAQKDSGIRVGASTKRWSKRKSQGLDDNGGYIVPWLDLTKPSAEVFI